MMTFAHVFKSCSQDSLTVQAIMSDVLGKLKETMPTLRFVYYRQDNEGCHRSSNTILGAVKAGEIGEETGQKASPAQVSRMMMTAKDASGNRMFSSSEFLTVQQITSFFSRLASKRSLAGHLDIQAAADDEDGSRSERGSVSRT